MDSKIVAGAPGGRRRPGRWPRPVAAGDRRRAGPAGPPLPARRRVVVGLAAGAPRRPAARRSSPVRPSRPATRCRGRTVGRIRRRRRRPAAVGATARRRRRDRRRSAATGAAAADAPAAGRAGRSPRPTRSLTRIALGRSDDGSQFGMFLQIFADGTVDRHRGGPPRPAGRPEAGRRGGPVGRALPAQGPLRRPVDRLHRDVHVVVYERRLGRLRAHSFSYSGNPQGCDHAVRHLHTALDTLQAKLSRTGARGRPPARPPAPVAPAAARPAPRRIRPRRRPSIPADRRPCRRRDPSGAVIPLTAADADRCRRRRIRSRRDVAATGRPAGPIARMRIILDSRPGPPPTAAGPGPSARIGIVVELQRDPLGPLAVSGLAGREVPRVPGDPRREADRAPAGPGPPHLRLAQALRRRRAGRRPARRRPPGQPVDGLPDPAAAGRGRACSASSG